MLNVVENINWKLQEIILNECENSLLEIIEQVLQLNEILLTEKEISLENCILFDAKISCDSIHLCETLCNIVKNAIEACKVGGKIIIDLKE